jgi:hypothetical protein
VQPRLQFVDTAYELVQRHETGQLDWISCNATVTPRLRRSLGSCLAVSVLARRPRRHSRSADVEPVADQLESEKPNQGHA